MTGDRTTQHQQMEMITEPLIGGDFTLTDQNGHAVRASDFRGRIMLVFFGFTHCPDICPVTMANLSQAMTLLGDKADQVAPIFITVDPERDTPPVLADYLSHFDARFVGLTGTSDQIKAVAAAYKSYYADHAMPIQEGHHHAGEYNVEHSAFIYLMGMDGKYVRLFPNNAEPQDIARGVERVLAR
ncbi:MAG: SCO family protein [Pseudomonadota bacterium]|nr:SCO family protein [Pseudomonadota bacterium]